MTIKCIKLGRLGLAILLTTLIVSGCDTGASVNSKTPNNSNTSSAQLWEGESAGYITRGNPTNDDVRFLIHLGRVQAAIRRANHHDKEEGMSNPFTPRILAGYAVIDPFVSGKSSSSLSLQPLLSEVAAPETFTIIMDRTSSKRMQRNATPRHTRQRQCNATPRNATQRQHNANARKASRWCCDTHPLTCRV